MAARVLISPREFCNSPGSFSVGLLCLSYNLIKKKKIVFQKKTIQHKLTGVSRKEEEHFAKRGQREQWGW